MTQASCNAASWQVQYRLLMEALAADSTGELTFIILNRSLSLTPYHRACLWDIRGKKPGLEGISGRADVDLRSTRAEQWAQAVGGIRKPERIKQLAQADFSRSGWDSFCLSQGNLSVRHVLWVPITAGGQLRAGLWLERWGRSGWDEAEVESLAVLAKSYGRAFEKLEPPSPARKLKALIKRKPVGLGLAFLAMILLLAVQVPLRTVAPCRVAPLNPIMISAPLNGVIEKVLVRPGQMVKKGQALLNYDNTVFLKDLEVARKQVQVAAASLDAARMQAFRDPLSRAKIALLENKLASEQVKLKLETQRFAKLIVRAPADGSVIIEKPWEWRGKPVQVGQRVMMLFTADQTELRLWIPQDQRIDYDRKKPVEVMLNAMPQKTMQAKLGYVGRAIINSPEGVPSFSAQANWPKTPAGVRIGFRGTAVVLGEEVPLIYWLIRRPWAWLRGALGW